MCAATRISDEMLLAAAQGLAGCVSDEDRAQGLLFPPISEIRAVSTVVATAVVQTALDQRIARQGPPQHEANNLPGWVQKKAYMPIYTNLVPGRE